MTGRYASRVRLAGSRARERRLPLRRAHELPAFAVVPSGAARWFLHLLRSTGLSEAVLRTEAARYRAKGRKGLAGQIEIAWAQLEAAEAHE
ncbi:hypothetical protein, partial [Intrasporangium chromatireducens]|uniref:hypothetical protein n=1 Tax=Intrasporangium chromatireducens TaxID=1386088 RepID=UPI0012DD57EE